MTNALMQLADRLMRDVELYSPLLPDSTRALMKEAATQLHTAAAEGGEAVACWRSLWPSGELGAWTDGDIEPEAQHHLETHGLTVVRAYLHPPTDSGAGRDGERMDWLERQHVEVRTPARYGSFANFHASPDEDEETSDLRAKVDAALRARAVGE